MDCVNRVKGRSNQNQKLFLIISSSRSARWMNDGKTFNKKKKISHSFPLILWMKTYG
jgi:hypothetical protein